MRALIAVLAGDGIGAEVTAEAVRALELVADRCGHSFQFEPALLGGAAIDATGAALPPATLNLCRRADAVLLGAVGGPKWSDPNAKVRPEQGLLQLRQALGLFANLRPVVPHPAVLDASPIKAELLKGVDDVPEKAVFHFADGLKDYLAASLEGSTLVHPDIFTGNVGKTGSQTGTLQYAGTEAARRADMTQTPSLPRGREEARVFYAPPRSCRRLKVPGRGMSMRP